MELIRPEALETVHEFLWDASKYELQVKYPAEIVATGGTEAQKIARRKWIKQSMGMQHDYGRQEPRRCFCCNGVGHEARDCHMGKGKDKDWDGQDRFDGGKGRPYWNVGKGSGKGFGKGKSRGKWY